MKTVILDENIPRKLKSRLSGHRVFTVPEKGWGGVKNGRLMALIDGAYDVFVTADKNLRLPAKPHEAKNFDRRSPLQ